MITTSWNLRTVGLASFQCYPWGFVIRQFDMNTLDGDELVSCPRDIGISGGDEEWLCLLYSACSGSAGDISVEVGLDCKGLDNWRGIVWDPGIVGKRCLMALGWPFIIREISMIRTVGRWRS